MKGEILLVKSPLNYTGGKFRLLAQLLPRFPGRCRTFWDLFAGGGNVGINVDAEKVVYNDASPACCGILAMFDRLGFQQVNERIGAIVEKYGLSQSSIHGYEHYGCLTDRGLGDFNRSGYLRLRDDFNALSEHDDDYYLHLYALVVFAFNNQIRFSRGGEFNLPVGKRDFNSRIVRNLEAFVGRLQKQRKEFRNMDFREISLEEYSPGDFVYCDPPYLIATASYNEQGGWTDTDENDLHDYLDALDARGISFALSNVMSHKGRANGQLALWAGKYRVHELSCSYGNSNYHLRNRDERTQEVLVTNLAPDQEAGDAPRFAVSPKRSLSENWRATAKAAEGAGPETEGTVTDMETGKTQTGTAGSETGTCTAGTGASEVRTCAAETADVGTDRTEAGDSSRRKRKKQAAGRFSDTVADTHSDPGADSCSETLRKSDANPAPQAAAESETDVPPEGEPVSDVSLALDDCKALSAGTMPSETPQGADDRRYAEATYSSEKPVADARQATTDDDAGRNPTLREGCRKREDEATPEDGTVTDRNPDSETEEPPASDESSKDASKAASENPAPAEEITSHCESFGQQMQDPEPVQQPVPDDGVAAVAEHGNGQTEEKCGSDENSRRGEKSFDPEATPEKLTGRKSRHGHVWYRQYSIFEDLDW